MEQSHNAAAQNGVDIKSTWRTFKATPASDPDREALRNTLVEHYLHLVRFHAERMHVKLPGEVELDDLTSSGVFGLIDAIDKFEPDRGFKFETYSARRIRGAILDELRAMDWVPRLARSRAHKVDGVRRQLEVELGRAPDKEEMAARLQVSVAQFERIVKDASSVGIVSLSRKWFEPDAGKDVHEIDLLRETRSVSESLPVDRKILRELLTRGLSRTERLIIVLYYFEEMTMKEIGATLDLSESRVSQIHSSLLLQLKAKFGHHRTSLLN